MMRFASRSSVAALALAVVLSASGCVQPPDPAPVPYPVPVPVPAPPPRPCPCPRPAPIQPWGPRAIPAVSGNNTLEVVPQVEAPPIRGADEPMVDPLAMPAELRRHNITSRGLGCCVFRTIDYAASWQGEPALVGFPEWMKENGIPGGGIPSKVAALIPKIAAARGLPVPRYIQYQGRSTALIELALKTGRLPGISWGGDHMLTCVHLDEKQGAILDNNDPGRIHWMPRDQFVSEYLKGGGGWTFVLLNPGPPPVPRNLRPKACCQDGGKKCCDAAGCKCTACDCVPGHRCAAYCDCPRAVASEGYTSPAGAPRGMEWSPAADLIASYSINGAPVSLAQVIRELFGESLTDDSPWAHLTVIGPEALRNQVINDLGTAPSLAPWRGHLKIRDYPPDHWAVACGFHAPADRLTTLLQLPDGRVMLRMDGYAGPDDFAQKLRRSDPTYDPSIDPTGANLGSLLAQLKFVFGPVPWSVWAFLGGAGAILVLSLK